MEQPRWQTKLAISTSTFTNDRELIQSPSLKPRAYPYIDVIFKQGCAQ